MRERLHEIFHQSHRELCPDASLPELSVEFYPFANINHTIRLREGQVRVRLSDVLEGAPESVLQAIAHILLAKMYRKRIERRFSTRYRQFVLSHDIAEKAHRLRQLRGRKRIDSAQGRIYDLEIIFDQLNLRLFGGLLARPRITWSRHLSRHRLGHYDPSHNAIVVSRIFDHPRVPRSAVEYIIFHEMLHLKHPVKVRSGRRCVHSAEFRNEEKSFPHIESAKRFLKHL